MTETAKAPVRCGLSGTALKYIACITMPYAITSLASGRYPAAGPRRRLASCGGIPVSTLLAADRAAVYRAAGLSHLLLSGRGGLSRTPTM